MWYVIAVVGGILLGGIAMFFIFGKNYRKFQWAYTVLQNHAQQIREQAEAVGPRIEAIEQKIDNVILAIQKELEDLRAGR